MYTVLLSQMFLNYNRRFGIEKSSCKSQAVALLQDLQQNSIVMQRHLMHRVLCCVVFARLMLGST